MPFTRFYKMNPLLGIAVEEAFYECRTNGLALVKVIPWNSEVRWIIQEVKVCRDAASGDIQLIVIP